MKLRFAAFLLAGVYLFSSCGEHSSTATEPSETEQTAENQKNAFYYPDSDPFADTQTRVLYHSGVELRYYNKITQEEAIFCFDPLCEHSYETGCISARFAAMRNSAQSVEYCEYDQRFYALRGEQLYSFAFDGSDLQHIGSFGEEGKFNRDNRRGMYQPQGLFFLKIKGQYVYFLCRDTKLGYRILMQYDAKEKKMNHIFPDIQKGLSTYYIGNDALYLDIAGDEGGLFQAGFEGGALVLYSEYTHISGDYIFDGEAIYLASWDYKGKQGGAITSKHFKTGEEKTIIPYTPEKRYKLLAVSDTYIYYSVRDDILDENYEYQGYKQERVNAYSKIYCLNRMSGETKIVLNELVCDTDAIFFYDENNVLIKGFICIPYALGVDALFHAQIDENGMFVNLTVLNE